MAQARESSSRNGNPQHVTVFSGLLSGHLRVGGSVLPPTSVVYLGFARSQILCLGHFFS